MRAAQHRHDDVGRAGPPAARRVDAARRPAAARRRERCDGHPESRAEQHAGLAHVAGISLLAQQQMGAEVLRCDGDDCDAIMVVVELTNMTHFVPCRTDIDTV